MNDTKCKMITMECNTPLFIRVYTTFDLALSVGPLGPSTNDLYFLDHGKQLLH